jgi:hypothetical protein
MTESEERAAHWYDHAVLGKRDKALEDDRGRRFLVAFAIVVVALFLAGGIGWLVVHFASQLTMPNVPRPTQRDSVFMTVVVVLALALWFLRKTISGPVLALGLLLGLLGGWYFFYYHPTAQPTWADTTTAPEPEDLIFTPAAQSATYATKQEVANVEQRLDKRIDNVQKTAEEAKAKAENPITIARVPSVPVRRLTAKPSRQPYAGGTRVQLSAEEREYNLQTFVNQR